MVKHIRIRAKNTFAPTKLPGADYVMNQYVGCQHACLYCYARFLPELVKKENVKGEVYMSSVSDPYHPIEKKLEVTRNVLKNMNKGICIHYPELVINKNF